MPPRSSVGAITAVWSIRWSQSLALWPMREVQKMDSLSAWYGKLAAEEKKTMVRRGLAAVALAGAAAIFVTWNVGTGPGEAAPAKTKTQAAAPAETAAAPSASAVSVDGFRSAKFGDDEKAVRAAIEKDF